MAEITPDNLAPRLQAMALARGFPAGWAQSRQDFPTWQVLARAIAEAHVLPDPDLRETPCGWVEDETEDRGSYDAIRGGIQLEGQGHWPALMLRPKGPGPHPAALLLHDHGSEFRIGKEKCIRPLGQAGLAQAWVDRFFDGIWIGDRLAAQGFVVLCVDALGWGERAGNGYESQQALACNLMQIGTSPAAVIAHQDIAAAAYLAAQPDIDASRVCAVGFSFGGFRAWQVLALSPQIRAAVSAGWMTSLPALAVPGNNHLRGQSAFWMTHPGLHRHLDLPDLAGLAAPKPLYVEVGADDHLFPTAGVAAGFEKLSAIWSAADAGASLRLVRPDGGHAFGVARQQSAFEWLQKSLRSDDSTTAASKIC